MPKIVTLSRQPTRSPEVDLALRRQAIQIAAQLPSDADEAVAVLEYAKTLVRSFMAEPGPV